MPYPQTLGEALELLRQHFGAWEIVDVAEQAGMNKATLYGWQDNPKGKVKKPARKHLDRIFGPERFADVEQSLAAPDVRSLAQQVQELQKTIHALTSLRKASPERFAQMVAGSSSLTASDRDLLEQIVEALTSQREATQQELREILARLRQTKDPPARPQRRRAHS